MHTKVRKSGKYSRVANIAVEYVSNKALDYIIYKYQ